MTSNDSALVVRMAQRDELGIIQTLNRGAFENDAEHDPQLVMTWPTDPATGGAYFSSRINGDGVVFVAETDGTIVGYVAGAMQPNEMYRSGRRSELENMFVQPQARRGGVGTALIDAFVQWSTEQGAGEVYVSAYFDNHRAVSFYQRQGFKSYSHDLLLNLRPPANTAIHLRPFHHDDAYLLADMHRRCADADGFDPLSTLEYLPSPDDIADNAAQTDDLRVAVIDSQVIGYVVISSWVEEDDTRVYLQRGLTATDFRSQGVATTMLDWSEARIRELDANNVKRPGMAVYGAGGSSTQPDVLAMLESRNYLHAFSLVEMELQEFPSATTAGPSGLAFRAATADDVHDVWQLNEIVYADRAFTARTSGFDHDKFVDACGDDLSLWNLAVADNQLVGFVAARIGLTRAEITEVTVHPNYRRRGLAKFLLQTNLAMLASRGTKLVRLHTSADDVSGARTLYSNLGFQPAKTYARYRKSVR